MKTTIKRLIAVMLAALMIGVSLPLQAFAATDAEATALKTAITAYENAMDGTVYTDMGSVYTIYLNAVKAYDQYKYGGNTSVDLATVTSQLTTATTAMQSRVFTGVDSSITVGQVTTDDSNYDTSEWYKNVLWVETNYSTRRSVSEQDYHGIGLYQPGITLLYDGKVAPTGTILVHGYGRGSTGLFAASRTRTLLAAFVTNNNLAFNQQWRGIPSNLDINWALWANENQLHAWSTQNPSGFPAFSTGNTYNLRSGRTNNNYRFANFYTFSGTMDANTPVLEITPQITCYVNSASSWKTDDGANMTLNGTAIHIVNYKRLIDTAHNATYADRLNLGSNYDEGGAAAYLAAYDTLTSLNISSYFTSSNNYTGAATAITNAIDGLTSAAAPTADGTGYQNLRTAIDNRKSAYEAGNIGYTAASWAEFADAYEDAQAIFTNISAYNDNSGAQTAADRLNNAQLVTLVAKVDTADLEIAIDEALFAIANSTAFTSASYSSSNIAAVVAAAQTAVWGSQANYKVDGEKLDDTSANQAIVAAQLAAVNNAIYALRVDTAATVPSAAGYSLDSAIAEGETYVIADYANGEVLATALTTGRNFADTINAVSTGVIRAKLQEYISDVQAIISAIRNLQPAFSKIANGTIANAGQKESVRVWPNTSREIYTVFDRDNNIIVFRRSASSEIIEIGEADITFFTYADYDSHLDAIYLHDNYNSTGELQSVRNGNGTALSSDQINALEATKGLSYTFADGSQLYVNNLRVEDSSTEYLGRDLNGNGIGDTTFDFTEFLTDNSGDGWPANGAISAKAGATHAAGQLNLSLAQKAEQTLSASTVPVNDNYSYTDYFGSLFTWKLSDVFTYTGWSHGRTQYTQTVNVIDVTTLMSLIDTCDALEGNEYTTASWSAFTAALTAAKGEMAYGSMTAAAITTECITRYTNLWNAYQALERCASNQPLKDALAYQDGDKLNVVATYQAGQGDWSTATWQPFVNAYLALTGNNGLGDRYSDANVRNFNTSEQPTINALAQALKDAYDALQKNTPVLPAIEAFEALTAALDDYTYYASDLTAVNNALAALPYSFYTMDRDAVTPLIDELNSEVAAINALTNSLTPVENFDKDAFQNYIDDARRRANDPDAYNADDVVSTITALETSAFSTVTIVNAGSYIGLAADAQQKVDQAEQVSLSIPIRQYTVVVKDADGNTLSNVGEGTYAYGTSVTINAGTANYKYDYVSNTGNTDGSHKTKDVGTLDSFTFTVQGNTTVTVGAPTASKPVTVTYKANLANANLFTINTDYAAAGTTITAADFTAPSYAFYSYQGFTQTTAANGDITVTLNYNLVAGGTPQYTIWNDLTEEDETYYFNELVTIDMDDAPAVLIAKSQDDYDAWYEQCDAGEFTDRTVNVAAYGNLYTFRAKEDLWTIYIDDFDDYAASYQTMKDETGADSAVYTNTVANVNTNANALVTYNGIALPEDYEIVEAGVLVQYNKQGGDLLDKELNFNTVGQDVGNDKVRRLKATKIHTEEDNRFSITLNLADGAKAKYRVYVNYKDGQGNAHTVMSDVTETITIG